MGTYGLIVKYFLIFYMILLCITISMSNLKELLLSRSSKGMLTQMVVAIIGAAIVITIGIYVISTFQGSISQSGWSAAANTTYTSLQTSIWNGLLLLGIAIIVMAAVFIISLFGTGTRAA